MLVLALDSSTRRGSVALARDGACLEVRSGDPSLRQAVRLPGELTDLLTAHGHTLAEVDLLAVTAGPGGFTGLRVGLATVQGLSLALGRRVFVASTLDLLAAAAVAERPEAGTIGAWMQGMRGEVFTAIHVADPAGVARPRLIDGPSVGTPDQAAEAWARRMPDGDVTVIGDGWPEHGEPLRRRFGDRLRPCATPPLAGVLAEQAARHHHEAVGPEAVRPLYVRRPDAVLLREQAGVPVVGDG